MKKGTSLSISIFAPVAGVLVLSVVLIFFMVVFQGKADREQASLADIRRTENIFTSLVENDKRQLFSLAATIAENEKVINLLDAQDRENLYESNKDLAEKIKNDFGITHWYFIGADGKMILRMYDPERFGDTVTRKTFKDAESSGLPAAGIELGKAEFALRSVTPVYDKDKKLVGYIEISEEIDHLLLQASSVIESDLILVVAKDVVARENFEKIRESKKEWAIDSDWDDYENHLILSGTNSETGYKGAGLSNFINDQYYLNNNKSSGAHYFGDFSEEEKIYSVGEFHLEDANKKNVGAIYVLVDITSAAWKDNVALAVILAILILAISFVYGVFRYMFNKKANLPLRYLVTEIITAEQSDYTKKVQKLSDNEIGDLAEGYNKLLDNVNKSRSEIKKEVKLQTGIVLDQKRDLENQTSAILNILEDVEGEKEEKEKTASELKKFEMAVEYASDHIVITDSEGYVLFANKAVEKITGYSINEVLGKKAGSKKLWGGLMDNDFYEKFWRTIKKDGKTFEGILKNKRKNGDEYDAQASVSPIKNKGGEVIFFVGIERDVTLEKEVDRAKTEFVSLASHQLRTPLSAINWYTEMLLNEDAGKVNPDQKSYLEEIYKGNKRMVDLVNSLLNVSRLELGTFEIKPEISKLSPVAKDVLDELKPQLLQKKQKYNILSDEDKKGIKVDLKLIRIIFQNLLSNAVKYTPNGGSINIKIHKNNKEHIIEISDTGYGIPDNQKDQIFTKLFRADNVRAMDTEGTGLGLYIIKSILKSSGCDITFKSKLNKGTTFIVKIPNTGMKEKTGSKQLS